MSEGRVLHLPTRNTAADVDDEEPQLVDEHLLDAEPDADSDGRRPVIPAAWRRGQIGQTLRQIGDLTWYRLAYHAARLPLYVAVGVFWAAVGAVKLAAAQIRWWWVAESTPLRLGAVEAGDPVEYERQLRLVRAVRAKRAYVLLAEIVGAMAVAAWLALFAPWWAPWAALAAAVPVLAHLGRPVDRPIISRAVMPAQVQPLTSDHVIQALARIGIPGITQALRDNPNAVSFPAPVRQDGPGWRADVDLPPGVTAAEVIERRDRYASALGRPLGCVWPEADPDVSPARLVTWVGKVDMARARQPAWPLLRAGTVDLFKPVPFGTDQRGRTVDVTMMYASWVIGAVPRMGKTFAVRLALLAAALDVRTELHVYDLKGTGDLSPLEPVAHRYRAGDDHDDIAYVLADLREVQVELRRRTKVIRDLPRDLCPENKVTPELADKRGLGLHPIVVGVDECQVLFEHPVHGGELEEVCTDLTKRGPAVGISLVLATQRPDRESLPPPISKNAVLRFCLKVLGHVENDMVLGTGMYRAGVRATMFSRRDLGIGYLAGETDDPRIVRAFYVDSVMADRVAKRARALREHAGRLSGHAIGEQLDETRHSYNLLRDVAAVIRDGEEKVWSETILTRLAELRPDVYTGWTTDQLALALRPYGVSTEQINRRINGQVVNRRGVAAAHITAALEGRIADL